MPVPRADGPVIAVLAFSPIARDARVLRQVTYLSRYYNVHVLGFVDNTWIPGATRVWPLPHPPRWWRALGAALFLPPGRIWPAGFYEAWYWTRPEHRAAYQALLSIRPDVIHANDVQAIPVAFRAAAQTGAQVIVDLHEYAPLELEDGRLWRFFVKPRAEYYLRRWMPQAAAAITVNDTLAERYAREWAFTPIVVRNAPALTPEVGFRATEPARIHLVHHGGTLRRRRTELMIEAIAQADSRYHLHFILVGDPVYIEELREQAQALAPTRIHFHPPVPATEVVTRIAQYDVGFYILPPAGYNEAAALPNKFFDFVNAGLAVCTGPSMEMARLSEQYGFGIVAPSFDPAAVAQTLNRLTAEDIDRMKRNALAARRSLNADVEMGKLLAVYERLLAEKA